MRGCHRPPLLLLVALALARARAPVSNATCKTGCLDVAFRRCGAADSAAARTELAVTCISKCLGLQWRPKHRLEAARMMESYINRSRPASARLPLPSTDSATGGSDAHASDAYASAQRALDRWVLGGRWEHWRWLPFEDETPYPPSMDAFAGKRILVLGGSTERELALHFQLVANGCPDDIPPPVYQSHGVYGSCRYPGYPFSCEYPGGNLRRCNWTAGYGCEDCVACCGHQRCAGGASSAHDYDWMDFVTSSVGTAARPSDATLEFSWKPEIHTRADELAFSSRFCSRPPDLLLLGKGLHDVAWFSQRSSRGILNNASAMEAWVASRYAHFVPLLRCLPDSTVVIVRTPYWGNKHGGWEPVMLEATRNATVALHAHGVFGPRALLLDGWVVSAARGPGSPLDSGQVAGDGHHFGGFFDTLVWALIERAYVWATGRVKPPPATLGGSGTARGREHEKAQGQWVEQRNQQGQRQSEGRHVVGAYGSNGSAGGSSIGLQRSALELLRRRVASACNRHVTASWPPGRTPRDRRVTASQPQGERCSRCCTEGAGGGGGGGEGGDGTAAVAGHRRASRRGTLPFRVSWPVCTAPGAPSLPASGEA